MSAVALPDIDTARQAIKKAASLGRLLDGLEVAVCMSHGLVLVNSAQAWSCNRLQREKHVNQQTCYSCNGTKVEEREEVSTCNDSLFKLREMSPREVLLVFFYLQHCQRFITSPATSFELYVGAVGGWRHRSTDTTVPPLRIDPLTGDPSMNFDLARELHGAQ